jgi:hypothetical protein
VRQLGAPLAIGVAIVLSLVTMSVLGLGCGENQPRCTNTSGPVLAVYASWMGLAGVVASVLLWRTRRIRLVALAFTALAYVAWLVYLWS